MGLSFGSGVYRWSDFERIQEAWELTFTEYLLSYTNEAQLLPSGTLQENGEDRPIEREIVSRLMSPIAEIHMGICLTVCSNQVMGVV